MQASFFFPLILLIFCSSCAQDPDEGAWPQRRYRDQSLSNVEEMQLSATDLPEGVTCLNFGVTPYLGLAKTRQAFAPVAAFLTDRLGFPVLFRVLADYDGLVRGLEDGTIDIGAISPLSYVLAREAMPDLHLIASSLSFGALRYSSFIVVRDNAPAKTLSDLRGLRFAYADRQSSTGWLLPSAALLDAGVDPHDDVTSVITGSHDESAQAVLSGRADFAGISSTAFDNARLGTPVGAAPLRILYKAGEVPYDALVGNPKLPASGVLKIAAAFSQLNTRSALGRQTLRYAQGVTGWIRGEDRRYDGIRRILERVREKARTELSTRHSGHVSLGEEQ